MAAVAIPLQDETQAEGGAQAVIARLRREIDRVQAAPRQYLAQLRTGVEALDALGAFRLGGAVELSGELSAGRTSLALSLAAAAGREQRLTAWVDGPGELYPPAAAARGVDLERLLWLRQVAPGQLVWSAVQLLRSGAFTLVVLDVSSCGVRLTPLESKKLLDAARAGGALLVVLTSPVVHGEGLHRLELASASEDIAVHVPRLGRHLGVARAELGASAPPARSCDALPPPARPEWPQGEPFVRPKKNLARDGHGLRGGRPGRDGPEPPLRPWLMAGGA